MTPVHQAALVPIAGAGHRPAGKPHSKFHLSLLEIARPNTIDRHSRHPSAGQPLLGDLRLHQPINPRA
jgi:hypothetical protein